MLSAKKIGGALLMLLVSACSHEQFKDAPDEAWKADWSLVANRPTGEAVYIDRSSVRKSGATVTYWTVSAPDQSPSSSKRTIIQIEENCSSKQWRVAKMIIHGAGLGPIYSEGTDWSDLPANSAERQATHNFVCSG